MPSAEAVEVVATEAEDEEVEIVVNPIKLVNLEDQHLQRATRAASIQIFLLEIGQAVVCISNMVVVHTFVQNLLLVLGRTSTLLNLQNEA